MSESGETTAERATDPTVIDALVKNKRAFLSFLERRVESRDAAEEILQAAFAKTVEKSADIRDDERAVAWFYRLLRNALVDEYRRADAKKRMLAAEASAQAFREERAVTVTDDELERVVCGCFEELLPTLKAEYAQIVRAVDLEGRAVAAVALELGITGNNASVRLLRARQALRRRLEATCRTCATHGCLDCTCSPGR